jgi:NHLM bacteriocin system secretion protein
VATVYRDDGRHPGTAAVTSPIAGRVLGLLAGRGDLIQVGSPVLSLEPFTRALEVVVYVPASVGATIRSGTPVQISPTNVPAQTYGYLRGTVRYVGPFPTTLQGITRTLGTDEMARAFAAVAAPIEVRVALQPDQATASGYAWTSSRGPLARLAGGTLCTATIILGQHRPIDMGA